MGVRPTLDNQIGISQRLQGHSREEGLNNVRASEAEKAITTRGEQHRNHYARLRAMRLQESEEVQQGIMDFRRAKRRERMGGNSNSGDIPAYGASGGSEGTGTQGPSMVGNVVNAFYSEETGVKWTGIAGIMGGTLAGGLIGNFIGGAAGGGWLGTAATVLLGLSGAVYGSQLIESVMKNFAPAPHTPTGPVSGDTYARVNAAAVDVPAPEVEKVVKEALAKARTQFLDGKPTLSETGETGYKALEATLKNLHNIPLNNERLAKLDKIGAEQHGFIQNKFVNDGLSYEEGNALTVFESTLAEVKGALKSPVTPPRQDNVASNIKHK
jgi:hypothetical protein